MAPGNGPDQALSLTSNERETAMAVLQPTYFLGARPPLHLSALDHTDRNEALAQHLLDYTSLPYATVSYQPDAAHITVDDLDDLEVWFVHLPAAGVDRIETVVEATSLWDGRTQAWALHVTAPSRSGGEARLLVYATVPARATVPAVLEAALERAVAA